MRRIVLIITVIASLLLPVAAAAVEEVVVSTGITFIDKVFSPVKQQLADAGLAVRILYGNPLEALNNLEAGAAEFAGASLDFENWLQEAAAKGSGVKDKSALTPYVVAQEETVLIVNVANSITMLSKDQLQGIFSGRIKNWKEVGGTDMPVLVIWPQVTSGALNGFHRHVMEGAPVTKDVLDVGSINETSDAVTSNSEAISIANGGKIQDGCKRITAPLIKRPLTLISKGSLTPKAMKLIDYLQSAEARKLFR